MNYRLLGILLVTIGFAMLIFVLVTDTKIKTECVDGDGSEIKNLPEGVYCETNSVTGSKSLDGILGMSIVLLIFIGLMLAAFSEAISHE